jgi:CBS domain-containing protein
MEPSRTAVLSRTAPFSSLPETEVERVSRHLGQVSHKGNSILFSQGLSTVDALHIIHSGSAERYFEHNGALLHVVPMTEGDVFGGISMLINNSLAIRSLRTTEPCTFLLLPRAHFLELCNRYPQFLEFFTNIFGKRMLDRSYASIVASTLQPGETSLPFFHRPVIDLARKRPLSCPFDLPLQQAATLMSERNSSSILITAPNGDYLGMVTDHDLRQKVVAAGLHRDAPVGRVMSTPLRTISGNTLIFEALFTMMQEDRQYLAVTDNSQQVVGMLSNQDILAAQGQSPLFLLGEIAAAPDSTALKRIHGLLPGIIEALIAGGAKASHLTRLATAISDAILQRAMGLTLKEHGAAPRPFAFIVLGSEGRKEQTLATDQDNALIYQDGGSEDEEDVHAYFLGLGQKICATLNDIGYGYCPGEIMAQNPQWCQPLAVWKEAFRSWIRFSSPEDLLNCSIFFDFRCGYGDATLAEQLRVHLQEKLVEWPLFLGYLAMNVQHFKPPLGFFRNFLVASKGEHRDTFNIKKVMVPIVDFARIHALKHGFTETNTCERLRLLHRRQLVSEETARDLEQAYDFLMQLRFSRQIDAITKENRAPDNQINPKKLTGIEQTLLKEIFSRIDDMQKEVVFQAGLPRELG